MPADSNANSPSCQLPTAIQRLDKKGGFLFFDNGRTLSQKEVEAAFKQINLLNYFFFGKPLESIDAAELSIPMAGNDIPIEAKGYFTDTLSTALNEREFRALLDLNLTVSDIEQLLYCYFPTEAAKSFGIESEEIRELANYIYDDMDWTRENKCTPLPASEGGSCKKHPLITLFP